jgi:hypothetical protein
VSNASSENRYWFARNSTISLEKKTLGGPLLLSPIYHLPPDAREMLPLSSVKGEQDDEAG